MRDVEQPEAGVPVPAVVPDVLRRPAHQVVDLRLLERGSRGPDPGGRAGDERRREARAVERRVARGVVDERHRDRDVHARRGEVDRRGGARERGRLVVLRRGGDGQHVRVVRGVRERIAFFELVAGGGDRDRAATEREHDRLRHEEALLGAPEAEVDHAAPGQRSLGDPLDHRGLVDRVRRARVEGPQDGLWVHADDPDPVHGRADHGAHSGAVLFALADDRLLVEHGRVRPADELGVRHVEARVDHGHGQARPRRDDRVGADLRDPPLRRDERVGHVTAFERVEHAPVGPDGAHRARCGEARHEADCRRPGHLPQAQRRRDQGRA